MSAQMTLVLVLLTPCRPTVPSENQPHILWNFHAMYLGQLFEFTCELTKNHRTAQNIPIFRQINSLLGWQTVCKGNLGSGNYSNMLQNNHFMNSDSFLGFLVNQTLKQGNVLKSPQSILFGALKIPCRSKTETENW